MAAAYRSLSEERKMSGDDFDSGDQEDVGRLSDRAGSPSMHMDHEKRMRREIANSNERRRMQSINAGFQSLRTLLPHHEGEKLSKAAILQQTAEYIYTLEQEKTRLLSQNCQLKRIINQHEGETSTTVKKRKTDSGPVTVVPAPVSESSDEGIGSMSPEPVSMGASGGTTVPTPEQENATEMLRREMMDLRVHLERERRIRLVLEDQVKSLENQLFPDRAPLQYQHEVAAWPEDPPLEEDLYPDLKQDAELSHSIIHQTVVEREIPPRRESQCSSHSGSRLFKDEVDGVTSIQSSAIVASPSLIFAADTEGPQMASLPIPVVASPCPSPIQTTILGPVSPVLEPAQPSVLEAAIKAEPKVEVERLPSPPSISDDQARLFINTSRQNLETIVEAIRHLEGDHLFSDDPSPHRLPVLPPQSVVTSVTTEVIVPHQDHLQERLQGCPENEAQEMPLALTTNSRMLPQQSADQRILKMKMDSFTYQQQQHRPGVIVVKHT